MVLGVQIQVLTLAWQALYGLSRLPRPFFLFFLKLVMFLLVTILTEVLGIFGAT